MKTSRVAAQSSVKNEEDCGVWLDTMQLKRKAQKKRSARPISKLLNPFTDGAGYNVAVALNFTQTKMEMPKTKQSSIANFFTCQRRVLNKMCTSGRPNAGAQEEFSSTGATTTGDSDDFNNEPLWSDVDIKQEGNTQQTEPHAALWWENEDEECNLASLPNIHRDCKKESSTRMSQLVNKSNITSYTCNTEQNSQDPLYRHHESDFLSSLPTSNSFNTFGGLFNAEVRTSTQKTFKRPSLQNDKENSVPKYPRMSVYDSHVQILSKTKLEPLQNDISLESCTQDQDEGCNSPIKWTKPKNSPKKKLKCHFQDNDDEDLSMLFTQDSQGFRVIAHRGLQTRSALKDQSNITAVKRPEEDEGGEDEEMLFTQDSQGNMVIKH